MSENVVHPKLGVLHLRPCKHQVAGHLFEEGKAGSLVDDSGHFYKPLQAGPRGNRELEFYESVRRAVLADLANGKSSSAPLTPTVALERHRSRLSASGATADGVHDAGAAGAEPDACAGADASPTRVPVAMESVDAPIGGLAVIGSDDGGFSASPMARTSGDGLDFAGAFGRASPAGPAAARNNSGDTQDRNGVSPGSSAGSDAGSDSGRGEGSAHSGVMVYASSLSKEGSRKDGTVLELRPGRVHAGGHSSYVPLRSIRFPSLDAEGCEPPPQPTPSQPSPSQPPRPAQGTQAGSQNSAPATDLPQDASETTLSHWATSPAMQRLSSELSSGLTLSVMPEGQSPPHATPGRLVRANSADACPPDATSQPEDFSFGTASDDDPGGRAVGVGSAQTNAAAASSEASVAAGPELRLQLQLPGLLPASSSGAASEACSRSSSPGRPPRIWRASAGWWPDGGQPPPPPPKLARSVVQRIKEEAAQDGGLARADGNRSGRTGPRAEDPLWDPSAAFSTRNAPMLRCIPRYYGTVESESRTLLELEDVARRYRHPSIIDVKVGFQTWYEGADEKYIKKCKWKDSATTQASLGFKICGMQVFRHLQRGYWRASKRWCKQMSEDAVQKALVRFANNEAGLRPADIYGGPNGALAQLRRLEAWFAAQRDFCFYSSSVLIIYEGAADSADAAAVTIRLVDFAHTFPSPGSSRDHNFHAGIKAFSRHLSDVLALDHQDCLL